MGRGVDTGYVPLSTPPRLLLSNRIDKSKELIV